MGFAGAEKRVWGKSSSLGPKQVFRHRLIARELKKVLEKGEVLDAGCGEGGVLGLLTLSGYRVFGFDHSELCIERVCVRQRENANNLWRGTMEHLPIRDSSFDGIVCGDVLEHLDNDEMAVLEFKRVLKPRGYAIVSVPAFPKRWNFEDEWAGHKRRYTKKSLVDLFEKKGFSTVRVYYWGFPLASIYHYFFYLPWLKRRLENNKREVKGGEKERDLFLFKVISFLWEVDLIFCWLPIGIGLIGVFQKQ